MSDKDANQVIALRPVLLYDCGTVDGGWLMVDIRWLMVERLPSAKWQK